MIKVIKNVLTLFFFVVVLPCCAQKKSGKGTVEEPIEAISPGVPFTLKRKDVYINLPEKVFKGNISGIVVLSVCLDSSKNLQGFKILKLQVNLDGERVVNFINESGKNGQYFGSEYPEEVQRYYPVIERYVNELQFDRDERIPVKALNEMTFIARLK